MLQNCGICLRSGPLSGILRAPLCARLPERWRPLPRITCHKTGVCVLCPVLCPKFFARRYARAFCKSGGRFRGLPIDYKTVVFVLCLVLCPEFCARRCARAFRKTAGRFRGLLVRKPTYLSYVGSSFRNSARAAVRARLLSTDHFSLFSISFLPRFVMNSGCVLRGVPPLWDHFLRSWEGLRLSWSPGVFF